MSAVVGVAAVALFVGQAQAVEPRFSPPVEDRSRTVEPRVAPPVVSRPAPAVTSRPAPEVRDTSLRGVPPSRWRTQEVGDTGVARDGVARGLQLRNIQCSGVVCRVFQDSAGDWMIAVEGGFPGTPGSTLTALTINMGERTKVESRVKGVFSDGRFRDSVSTYRLAPGTYAVGYGPLGSGELYAAVQFEVVRHALAPSGRSAGASAPRPDTAAAAAWRRRQTCLALATNDNLTCD